MDNSQNNNATIKKIAIILTVCLTALRIVRELFFTSLQTGFSKGGEGIKFAIYIAAFVGIVVVFAFSLAFKIGPRVTLNKTKSKPAWIISLLLGLSMVYNAFESVHAYLNVQAVPNDPTSGKVEKFANMMCLVFAIFSAGYLLIVAKDEAKGTDVAEKRKIFALAPACWSLSNLITLFTTKISFMRVPELTFRVFGIAFCALFFIAYAQKRSHIYSDTATRKLFAYGVSAIMLLCATIVPRFIFMIANGTDNFTKEYSFSPIFVFVILFVASTLFAKREVVRPNAETQKSTETEEA